MLKVHIRDKDSVIIEQDKSIENLRDLVGLYVFIQEDTDDNIIFYAGQDEYSEFLDKIGLAAYECVGGMVCDVHGNIDAITEDIEPCYPIQWDDAKKAFKVGTIKKMDVPDWEEQMCYVLTESLGVFIYYYLHDSQK